MARQKFKVGDQVKRICGTDRPNLNMYRGKIYTVESCGEWNVQLIEASKKFDPNCFELVGVSNPILSGLLEVLDEI